MFIIIKKETAFSRGFSQYVRNLPFAGFAQRRSFLKKTNQASDLPIYLFKQGKL